MNPTTFLALRAGVLVITLFTGFTALVYEVTWHYYLANLLGSQAKSASLIVATFLGGLAIGYAIFGRVAGRGSSRWLVRACGVLEALIGVWALLFPFVFDQIWSLQAVIRATYSGILSDLLLSSILIGLPTAMMGASLPLLTQGLSRSVADAAPFHAKIYVVNTFGAFAGCFAAGFFLLPTFGLSSTMFWMGIVNLAAGAALIGISIRLPEIRLANSAEPEQREEIGACEDKTGLEASARRILYLAAVAFLGGLVSITVQTILIRVMALTIGASTYAFSMVVSGFILVLALGAWLLAERLGKFITLPLNQFLIVAGLTAVYLIVPYLPYSAHIIRTLLTSQPPAFWLYYLLIFLSFNLLIAVPVGAIGATLPILFRESRDRAELLGQRVGMIYGSNTVGCVLGAIVGGYLSLYVLDLDGVLRICVAVSALTLLLIALQSDKSRQFLFCTMAIALGAFSFILPPWPDYAMNRGTFRMTDATPTTYKGFKAFYKKYRLDQTILAHKDDPNSTIAVVDTGEGARSIIVNGKSDGSTRGGDRATVTILAHLPALLQHTDSDRVAIVGFGTGITVGTFARYDEIKHIDVLEIAHAVKKFAPLFDEENGGASQSPKVEWQLGDAYRYLLDTPRKYAIIASEPSNPWVGGVERLYSTDFYSIVRKKLAPGGIYAQWFHSYSISNETMALVLNTFRKSFPHVHLFERSADLILIGSEEPLTKAQIDQMRGRYDERAWIRENLTQVGYSSVNALLASEVWTPWSGLDGSPVHSLDKPKLSYWAGRDFFLEATATIRKFAELPMYKGSSRADSSSTLLATDLADKPESERLTIATAVHCGIASIGYFSGWEKANAPCKLGLIALTVKGILPASNTVNSDAVNLFKTLDPASTEPVMEPIKISDINLGLDWVRDFGAPYLRVDPGKLRTFTSQCFQSKTSLAADCRGRLIMALAANGFVKEAQDELESFIADRLPVEQGDVITALAAIAHYNLSSEQKAWVKEVDELN